MKNCIVCKECPASDCFGCNIYILFKLLQNGKFNLYMDVYHQLDYEKLAKAAACYYLIGEEYEKNN